MIIAISGTQNTGKSTVIKDFLVEFPMYKEHPEKLREYLIKNDIKVNQETNKESQRLILDWYCDAISKYNMETDNIIFDRSPLDCIVYSLRAFYKGGTDIDAQFIMESIEKVKKALQNINIVFFIPRLKNDGIKIVEDGFRDTDETFIMEIDSIFKKIVYEQMYTGKCEIFGEDKTAVVFEIHGSRKQRVDIMKLYVVSSTGNMYAPENSLINQDMIDALGNAQKVLAQQKNQIKSINFIKDRIKKQ